MVALCGLEAVRHYRDVKSKTMRLATVIRELVAEDLGGTVPSTGKQFVTTQRNTYRIATGGNSDNSTEALAHKEMGAVPVQVFDEITNGSLPIDVLYAQHGQRFDMDSFLDRLDERL